MKAADLEDMNRKEGCFMFGYVPYLEIPASILVQMIKAKENS